jgi:hypothetical protein
MNSFAMPQAGAAILDIHRLDWSAGSGVLGLDRDLRVTPDTKFSTSTDRHTYGGHNLSA